MAKREKTSINDIAASSQKSNSPYILIVEDEPTHAVIIRHAIQSADPKAVVKVVESLKEYRIAIANSLPEVALIDYFLPDGKAFETLTSPPEDGQFPIVVMTNSGDEKLAVKAIKAGALDYIAKTTESFQLVPHTIEHALREWKILMDCKQAEGAFMESEENFRSVAENLHDVFFITDVKGNITYISPAVNLVFGYKIEEMKGHFFGEYLDESELPRILPIYENAIRTGIPSKNLELRAKRIDGKIISVELSTSIIVSRGKVKGTAGVIRDISERKRAERELRESELRYKMLSELVTDYVYRIGVSSDGEVTLDFVSDGFYSITGRSREEVRTVESWRKIFHPDDLDKAMEFLKRLIIDHQSGEMQCRSYVHGHTLRWININAKAEWDEKEKRVTAIIGTVKDITERRQAEDALRESEEKYRSIVEQTIVGIGISKGNQAVFANNALLRMFNYDNYEEFIKIPLLDHVAPSSLKIISDRMKIVADGKIPPPEYEYDIVCRGGQVKTLRVFSSHLHSGGEIYIHSVFQDITDRKQRENELQREQNFIKSITETSPIGITRLDRNGTILFANMRAEQILGLSKSKLSGRSYNAPAFNITDAHGDVFPDELLPFNLVKNDLKPVKDIQHAISWPDGQRVLLSINAAPLYNDLGQFDGIISSIEDITEKKKVEEALRESESSLKRQNELLSTLLENLKIGVFMVEAPTGKPLIVNQMAIKLLGRGILPDANRNNLSEVYNARKQGSSEPYPVIEMPIVRSMYGESSHIDDMVVQRPDSTEVILEVFGSSIKDENGRVWAGLVSFQDITERKQMEDQLRQMQKLEGLGTLAGGIAHDFNNILGIILAYISSIKLNRGDNKKVDLGVETIIKTVDRGKMLVQQILTFARKTKTEFGLVNANDVVKEIMSMIYETFPKLLTYTQNIDNDIPCIYADHSQLHQALLNLCVNARDAMPGGGVLTINTSTVSAMSLHAQHPDAAASSYVCIDISDTGEGMSEKIKQRIFDPFFTTKEKGKGTGLGLAVVFGIIQTHKGFIDVESEIGKGTTFRLYLPASQNTRTISEKEEEILEDISGGTETLLVVEDEEMLLISLQTILIEKGYKVLTARDGLEALKVYQENSNDIALVLTDLGLPTITGLEVCQRISKIKSNERIILATGFLDPDKKSEFLTAGIKHFLYKPYDPKKVLKVVREVLDDK
jgi:two-component system, cell cycle sensor histidine kinase and response regulator CckA